MSDSLQLIKNRYAELCAKRDSVNEHIAPIQRRLDSINSQIQERQAAANEAAAEIQKLRGGRRWIEMKHEIGLLAKALSGIQ